MDIIEINKSTHKLDDTLYIICIGLTKRPEKVFTSEGQMYDAVAEGRKVYKMNKDTYKHWEYPSQHPIHSLMSIGDCFSFGKYAWLLKIKFKSITQNKIKESYYIKYDYHGWVLRKENIIKLDGSSDTIGFKLGYWDLVAELKDILIPNFGWEW